MEALIDFKTFRGSPPSWGHRSRRALFEAACKYLGISPTNVENIYGVGFHSVLHSSSLQLLGEILDKVKRDPAIISQQNNILTTIKHNPSFKKDIIIGSINFDTQLGGQRAAGEMWKQALGFWRWPTKYSATWEMACDELTWAVRSVRVRCNYKADKNGKILITYSFSDTLDLRPAWGRRSNEYNAICCVLGFLYHDVIGGNDELKITANWNIEIQLA